MELQDYLRVIRKRWWIIALTFVVTLGAAVGYTAYAPKMYQATAQLYVSASGSDSVSDLAMGSSFTQKQMKTYADLITSPFVLDSVHQKLRVPDDQDLASSIQGSTPPDTVLLSITVTDTDKETSQRVANAVAKAFAARVPDLQSDRANQSAPVKATLVRPAVEAAVPVTPQPVRNAGLGAVLGLLLGLGLALLRDTLDSTIKNEADVKAVTDTTLIGAIPFDRAAAKQPLLVQADPAGARAEAFRTLRTNLHFVDAARHPKSIVITSPLPDEGKTTTAANLALTLGASGATVCVIEGDLRRPKLLEYMGMEGAVGLTSVLIGGADLKDVLQPFAQNVTVLGAGPIPPNPSELLGSRAMEEVLAQLTDRFDYVIVDAPPVLPVTDAAVVSRIVDGTILLIRTGAIKRDALERSLSRLETVGARVLGIVMNRVPTKGADSYSYSYSHYGHTPGKRPLGEARIPQAPSAGPRKSGESTKHQGTSNGRSALSHLLRR